MAIVQKAISIPEPINQVDSLWRTTQALKEAVEVLQGIRGNRAAALEADLEDATTIINNITGGGVPGITTLVDLIDTDLTGQAQYDLLFNVDGLNWEDTAGQLQWDGTTLQLANDLAISWLNQTSNPIELLRFLADAGTAGDDYWDEVQLLAKFEGTDAATAYTEVSQNAAIATFVANAQLDTAQFNFGAAALLLDGTGDSVTFPDIAAYDHGTSDWTHEGFVRFNTLPPLETSIGPGNVLLSLQNAGGDMLTYAIIQDGFGYRVRLEGASYAEVGTISGGISTGVWYHWAVTRASGTIRGYFNGNYETSDFGTEVADMGGPNQAIRLGALDATTAELDGWLDDYRMTIGTARYTGTSPYTIPSVDFPVVQSVPASDTFTVGDPGYVTNIEGTEVQINGVAIEQNATHTGEVTGDVALTLDVSAITNKTDVVADAADDVVIHDDSDGSLKKVNLSSITDAGYF